MLQQEARQNLMQTQRQALPVPQATGVTAQLALETKAFKARCPLVSCGPQHSLCIALAPGLRTPLHANAVQ
jgi:hypothetical protein